MSTDTPDPCNPKYAPTGDVYVSPWAAGVVGDISGTETTTTQPDERLVAVDENWQSYHNPSKLSSHHDMILTTEAIAREHDAVGCTKCFGGGVQYDFNYVGGEGVLP